MNLLLLPGNSVGNKEWIEKVEKALKPLFENTTIQYYDHWQNGEKWISYQPELTKIQQTLTKWKEYVVFAKSIGTVLALKAINQGIAKPLKCIFVGMPLTNPEHREEAKELMSNFYFPTVFVQHTEDPVMGAEVLKNFIEELHLANYKFFELPGNTHDYGEIDKIREIIQTTI